MNELKEKEYIVLGKDIDKRDYILVTFKDGLKKVHCVLSRGLWDILESYADDAAMCFTVKKKDKILKITVEMKNNYEVN